MGLPTLYLTQEHNVRLGKWVGAVPRYQEVVRATGYFETIRTTLNQWQQCPPWLASQPGADRLLMETSAKGIANHYDLYKNLAE